MREKFYVEKKQGDFCKNGESNKRKYWKITNRTAYQKHQFRYENKMVSSDTEYTRLIASKL